MLLVRHEGRYMFGFPINVFNLRCFVHAQVLAEIILAICRTLQKKSCGYYFTVNSLCENLCDPSFEKIIKSFG